MVAPAEYPAISDYGLIGDMHSCALVSSAGSVDWCCFPRFDSNAIFGRILDWHKGGYFKIAPRNAHTISALYSRHQCAPDHIHHREWLSSPDRLHAGASRRDAPIEPYKVGESHQIMRIIECTEGSIALNLECHPRFEYGGIIPMSTWKDPISDSLTAVQAPSLYTALCRFAWWRVALGPKARCGKDKRRLPSDLRVTLLLRFQVPQQCGDREKPRGGDGVLAELE